MRDLHARALGFIRRHGLFSDGEKAIAGLSGGPDSVALVLILSQLAASGDLDLRLHLAHLNHGLRGAESDGDESFCRRFAEETRLPITVSRADLGALARRQGRSVEAAARAARYGFLGRVAAETSAPVVAVAHHADDVAETVLLRLLRGASVTGLGAMMPCRPLSTDQPEVRLVRPLLEVRKAELLTFLRREGRPYREDRSNRDVGYTRNRVRHVLVPLLEREFPSFSVSSLCALNGAALELSALLEGLVDAAWPGVCRRASETEVVLDAAAMAAMPPALRKAAAVRALRLASGKHQDRALRAEHYEALARLPGTPVGSQVGLPGGLVACREHSVVRFGRPQGSVALPERDLPVPGTVELPEAGMTITCRPVPIGTVTAASARQDSSPDEVYVRRDATGTALRVRSRKPGDRFHPLGAPGARRLKEYLIDRKVPRGERDRLPLVTTAEGEIVWVVGHQIGDRFKLADACTAALGLLARRL